MDLPTSGQEIPNAGSACIHVLTEVWLIASLCSLSLAGAFCLLPRVFEMSEKGAVDVDG